MLTLLLLALGQWSYSDSIGDPVPAPGPVEAWKPVQPEYHPPPATPPDPPAPPSPAPSAPPSPAATAGAGESQGKATVTEGVKRPPAVPPPAPPPAAGMRGWIPPMPTPQAPPPPAAYQLADAAGQVWLHTDPDYLSKWVSERNYFRAAGFPAGPVQAPRYVPFGAAPVYYQAPAYSCGPGGCGFR